MKTRLPIPPASLLHELFVYRFGNLYWRLDSRRGKVKAGDKAGYVDPQGYVTVGIYGRFYKAHRLIWRMHHPKGKMPHTIDHIDGNRSNNVVENLRIATHAENMRNRRPQEKSQPRKGNKLTAALGDINDT